jgi:hypothetical protein
MLKMHGGFSILSTYGPSIRLCKYILLAKVDHRFNGKHKPFFQYRSRSSLTVIGNLGVFMHAFPETMSYQFSHYPVSTLLFGMFLYGERYIAHPVAGNRFFYPFIQGFLCYFHKFHHFRRRLPYHERIGMVAMVLVLIHAHIHCNDVTFLQFIFPREAMYHHIIHRDAGIKWITMVIQERRNSPVVFKKNSNELIQ